MNPAGNELTKTLEEGCESLAIISSRLFLPVSIEPLQRCSCSNKAL